MQKTIEISVRNLVEFVLRSGDINSSYVSSKRMLEGIRIHQKIQKKRKAESELLNFEYNSEVYLKYSFEFEDFTIMVDGRADSVTVRDGKVSIEEIKSTYKEQSDITYGGEKTHLAQAACYGYIYCVTYEIDEIEIILTYVNCETNEETSFPQIMNLAELYSFVYGLFEKYYAFAKMDYENTLNTVRTALSLSFPHNSYRPNQRELMAWVYKAVKQNRKLFVQAPTGMGKTISTIFPGIKAIGGEMIKKIFYLTAKTTTRAVAEEAFLAMEKAGLMLKCITLTGKEKICFLNKPSCNPYDCKYARGHFDRINACILDLIGNETGITRNTITEYAQKHMVCPHELSLDATNFCSLIICDYNYVYDPKVRLKRFFSDDKKNNFLILTDESHNLVDRARDMFSAELKRESFKEVKKLIKNKKTSLYTSISKIDSYFTNLYKERLTEERHIATANQPEEAYNLLPNFITNCDKWLAANQGSAEFENVLNLYFEALDYMRVAELYDSRYKCLISTHRKNMAEIKLKCVDPSFLLSEIQKTVTSCVYFSATLTPIEYFKAVLGGVEDDYCVCAPSPFDRNNLLVAIDGSISTKYKDRPASYEKIADDIYAFISAKTGNYFVFFSSYEFLSGVEEIFNVKYQQVKSITQKQDMTEDERDIFLSRFDIDNKETLIGFLVLGGVFSEGVDLKGEKLIGAVVVGVGLPLITRERDIIANYYGRVGFEYAYIYPGMNKVMQAAGRVIRHEADRGALLLIDSRFLSSDYKRLLPPHWEHYKVAHGSAAVNNAAASFWSSI